MARAGRRQPNHVLVLRAPVATIATATGTLAVTMGAFTLAASGTATGLAATGWPQVAVSVGSGRSVAVGGNVVAVMPRHRRARR